MIKNTPYDGKYTTLLFVYLIITTRSILFTFISRRMKTIQISASINFSMKYLRIPKKYDVHGDSEIRIQIIHLISYFKQKTHKE